MGNGKCGMHSAFCALAAVLIGFSLEGCGRGEPVIKIGFVAPLTGDQAPHGEDLLNGAMLAI